MGCVLGGRGGFGELLQLLLQRICFGWPAEDVSVDFFLYRLGFYFILFIFFSLTPPEESVLSAPEWEAVNGI